MSWTAQNRRVAAVEASGAPLLTDAMKQELTEKYFPRYPTRRAVLLPALHMVQHEHGWIPMRAMQELAEFLGISPAEAVDAASFYEEYWLKPKGKYLLQVCRSLVCEVCGSRRITDHIKRKLRIAPGQTTADGKFTLMELECLGACAGAPAALINEVLFENLTMDSIDRVLDALPDDPKQFKDPSVTW